jgi:hypothetical protein
MPLLLVDALTQNIIAPATIDNTRIYICTNCGNYLVYSQGQYCFTCQCFKEKL